LILKKVYAKEKTKDIALVTDEGEFPIWEKDYEKYFSTLSIGDEIGDPDALVTLAVRRQVKKSAVKKIAMGNITRLALIKKLCAEKVYNTFPDRADVEKIVDKLALAGFINDASYARRFVEKCIEKSWGEYKIRASMRERGFEGQDIDTALENCNADWVALARAFAEKEEDTSRESLYRKLSARGFSGEVISCVLNGD
jgi:regulatory protein